MNEKKWRLNVEREWRAKNVKKYPNKRAQNVKKNSGSRMSTAYGK